MDFVVSAEQGKNKKKAKRELKSQRNIRMTVIPIIVGALGTVREVLKERMTELEIRGRNENDVNISTALLKRPGDMR